MCDITVTVTVPTKWDYKQLEVKCQSSLSHEFSTYCPEHDAQQYIRCSQCGVTGFTSQDQINDHYILDCG